MVSILNTRYRGVTFSKLLLMLPVGIAILVTLYSQMNHAGQQLNKTTVEATYRAVSKEYIAIIFETYNKMRLSGQLVNQSTTMTQLIEQNLKAKRERHAQIDLPVQSPQKNAPVGNCAQLVCYRLPNNAVLVLKPDTVFQKDHNAGGHPYAMWVSLDPDGRARGKVSTVDDTVSLVLINDGRMYTTGSIPEPVAMATHGQGETLLFPGDIPNPSWLKQ